MLKRANIIPVLISVLITVGIYLLANELIIKPNFDKFLEMFITAFSIIIGFLFTTATILNSYRNEKLDFIRKSGGMKSMYALLKRTIYSGFFAIFLSIVYFLFKEFLDDIPIVIYGIVAFNILAMIYGLSFTRLFLKIIAND